MRREYDVSAINIYRIQGLPLHAQGIRIYILFSFNNIGITPACAGNTEYRCNIKSVARDYPCMRREYYEYDFIIYDMQGLPLHAQGIQLKFKVEAIKDGITPACAGNTA